MSGRTDPKTLSDVVLVKTSTREGMYGLDHSPAFPDDQKAAIFAQATSAMHAFSGKLDPLAVMTVLGAVESATALLPPPQPIYTATVELAQAWFLRDANAAGVPDQEASEELVQALSARSHLFLEQTSQVSSDDRSSILKRRMILTASVRHADYPHHAALVARAVGDALAGFGKPALGVDIADAMRIVQNAAAYVTLQLKALGVPRAVARWSSDRSQRFDPAWITAFEIDPAVLGAVSGYDGATVSSVLGALAMRRGELAGANVDHFHLANPVWRKPFVLDDDRLYLFSPGTTFSSSADIMADMAGRVSKQGLQALGNARGSALETLLGRTLPELMPSGEVLTGVHWHDPIEGKNRETDGLVLIDGIAMIFEAKGDALNPAARRGSSTWLSTFDDIVSSAAYQSGRLEAVIRDHTVPTLAVRSDQGERVIRKADIRHVVRFGVSFERVTMASSVIDTYLADRIRREGAEPMPILTIADLWQIRDLLPSEGHRVHYLLRRAEIETTGAVLGDELDLIALYLNNGFVGVGGRSKGPTPVVAYGLSDFLRPFQKGTPHHDASVVPPKRTIALWNRLVREMEEKRPKLWTSIVYDLLNIELASQERFLADIKALRRRVRRSSGKAYYDAVMMRAPNQLRPSAFVCLVAGRMPTDERVQLARDTFAKVSDEHPSERVTVLVLDASKDAVAPAFTYYRGDDWS